jgi:hypothetical protein
MGILAPKIQGLRADLRTRGTPRLARLQRLFMLPGRGPQPVRCRADQSTFRADAEHGLDRQLQQE